MADVHMDAVINIFIYQKHSKHILTKVMALFDSDRHDRVGAAQSYSGCCLLNDRF